MKITSALGLAVAAALCAMAACAGGQTAPASGFGPLAIPPLQPGETSTLPLEFVDHAVWTRPAPDMPVLEAGALPRATAFPQANSDFAPAWNTFETIAGNQLAGIVEEGGKLDPVEAAGIAAVMIAAPEKAQWMVAGIVRKGQSITVHVKSWDPPAAEAEKLPAGRRAYLVSLGHLAAGDYDLGLVCDHYEGNADGLYRQTGKREVATTELRVGPGAAAPAVIRQADLKTERVDVKAGTPEVPPLHWARQFFGPFARDPSFEVKIGTLNAREALAKLPQRPNDVITPTPPPAGKAPNLVACIVSPTLASGQYMALDSISVSPLDRSCVIGVTLWRDNGGRGGNVFSRTELLVPLSFLAKGEQKVTVQWQEFHARSMLTPYTPSDPPAQDATVKVIVE